MSPGRAGEGSREQDGPRPLPRVWSGRRLIELWRVDSTLIHARTHFINRAVLFEIAMLIFPHDKTRRADRRTMGNSGAFDPEYIAACRRSRQAGYAQRPGGAQWHPVGAAHGCGVGRSAGALSLGFDLLSPIQPLGAPRGSARYLGGAGARLGRPGQDQSLGMLYRRHLCSG